MSNVGPRGHVRPPTTFGNARSLITETERECGVIWGKGGDGWHRTRSGGHVIDEETACGSTVV